MHRIDYQDLDHILEAEATAGATATAAKNAAHLAHLLRVQQHLTQNPTPAR